MKANEASVEKEWTFYRKKRTNLTLIGGNHVSLSKFARSNAHIWNKQPFMQINSGENENASEMQMWSFYAAMMIPVFVLSYIKSPEWLTGFLSFRSG